VGGTKRKLSQSVVGTSGGAAAATCPRLDAVYLAIIKWLMWLLFKDYHVRMKIVTLTQLKNNFSALMDLVRRGKTSLLVYDRITPVIKVIYAGGENDEDTEHSIVAQRLERAGLLRRAPSQKMQFSEVSALRVRPKRKADLVAALLANRAEDR